VAEAHPGAHARDHELGHPHLHALVGGERHAGGRKRATGEPLGLDEENLADLQGSLKTIQSRSKGLVDFVQAYKSLTHTPKLRIEPVAVTDLFTQVNILCKGPLLARGIPLHVRLPEEA
jgi:hypothetical protein